MKAKLTILFMVFYVPFTITAQLYDQKSMPEAKFYFASQPFTSDNAGSKTSFRSDEFIYGRLELNGKTIKEAFQLDKYLKQNYFLYYYVLSYKNDKQTGSGNSIWNALQINEATANQSFLNFDVLPEPSKAKDKIGMATRSTAEFDKPAAGPMYQIIRQSNFPTDGEYKVYVQFHVQAVDGWGNYLPDDKFPFAEGSFNYTFSSNDVAGLTNNYTAASEAIRVVKVNSLPEYFKKPVAISDASVSIAKVTPIIKNYLASDGIQVLKVAIQPASSMWSVVKNDFGIITYRYVTGYYSIVYKKNGICQLGSVRIFQDYLNNGKYGNLYCKFWGEEGVIDCARVQ